MPNGTILLIDDEALLRQVVARTLELKGYTVRQAPDAMCGLELLRDFAAKILLVLSDVKLPDGRGLDLLTRYKALAPLAEVVLMTAYGTIADGVRAMKKGAFDYLTKGDADDQLRWWWTGLPKRPAYSAAWPIWRRKWACSTASTR